MTASPAAVIADVGGTHTRCALVTVDGRTDTVQSYRNDRFDDLAHVIREFLAARGGVSPGHGAFAVAAPIVDDEVRFTNRRWRFSIRALETALDLKRLQVVNDFAAQALALTMLKEADSRPIGGGRPAPGGTRAVLGPGTGLGIAGLVGACNGWIAVPGEGGHVTLPAVTPVETRIIARLRARFGHCSAERVLSGPGLSNLHSTLAVERGVEGEPLEPEEITLRASDGDPLASECLELFFSFLGTLAGDVALTFGALGGVYLSGGILPDVATALEASQFRARFEDKGRYREYLARIPTRLITIQHPALLGLAYLLTTDARIRPESVSTAETQHST
ncbi:glucokinase [soil metagenome]